MRTRFEMRSVRSIPPSYGGHLRASSSPTGGARRSGAQWNGRRHGHLAGCVDGDHLASARRPWPKSREERCRRASFDDDRLCVGARLDEVALVETRIEERGQRVAPKRLRLTCHVTFSSPSQAWRPPLRPDSAKCLPPPP